MLFSFILSKTEYTDKALCKKHGFGEYNFYCDENTCLQSFTGSNRRVLVFGLAMNLKTGAENIAEDILKNTSDLKSVIDYEKNLGGKYVIFYSENTAYYCIPDATASIPVYYGADESGIACTSHCKQITDRMDYSPDKKLMNIRRSGDISQAMPYDVTEYKEIKQLLPNHYLDLNCGNTLRFINQTIKLPQITATDAAQMTAPHIKKLTEFYLDKFHCFCPITGGRDSRVVLASMLNVGGKTVDAYTIRHSNHSEDNQDLTIPRRLAEISDINYRTFCDATVENALIETFDARIGKDRYSHRTLMIAKTVLDGTKGNAIINGDIIGQVGKCSLHRDIPQLLATPGYFLCKLHNYSHSAKKLLKVWLKEIKASGEKVSSFDLFSVENRMGRWAAQENIVYNTLGQVYLNVFNSRSIIYEWTRVDRKERKLSRIHIELIKILNEHLLNVDFESDSSALVRFSKSNGVNYYLFSRFKHFAQGSVFCLRKVIKK